MEYKYKLGFYEVVDMAVIIREEIDSIEIEEILTEYFNSFDSEFLLEVGNDNYFTSKQIYS